MNFSTWIKLILLTLTVLLGQQLYVNREKLIKQHNSKQERIITKAQDEKKSRIMQEADEDEEKKPRDFQEMLAREELLIQEINRMAHRFDSELFDFIVRHFSQLSERAKGSFVERIGKHRNKKVNQFLYQIIRSDENQSLRLRAIGSVSKGKGEDAEREKFLKELYLQQLQHKDKPPLEKLIIIGSYYQILTDNNVVSNLLDEMFKLVEDARSAEDSDLVYRGLLELNKIDPENQRLLKMAEEILREKTFVEYEELNNFLIRMLAKFKPKFIEASFFDLFSHPSQRVKVELINSLSMVCPQDIYPILGKIITDYPETRLHLPVARQLVFFDKVKSEKFFQDYREQIKIDEDTWRKIRLKILESELSDSCKEVVFERPNKLIEK